MSFNAAVLNISNPVERLAKVLKENQDKLNLSKDGYVSVNMKNEEAVKAIKKQMGKLQGLRQTP